MTKKEIVGLLLVFVALAFFVVFIWWGTQDFKPEFGVGIILLASGIFLSGILTFSNKPK